MQKFSPECHLVVNSRLPGMGDVGGRAPALENLLAVGCRDVQERNVYAWLSKWFGFPAAPLAALSLLGEGLDPDAYYWLHADPVHFQLQRDSFLLADPDLARMDADESRLLIDALNRHFEADGLLLLAPHPQRWYLRVNKVPAITTHPLQQVIGRNVEPLLPQGADAARWRGWLNEVQMLLHDHPVNRVREDRGQLPINSVWLHGGGAYTAGVMTDISQVWADDVLVGGLALASGLQLRPSPASATAWLEQTPVSGAHLIILDQPGLSQLDQGWCSPLLDALRQRRVSSLTLHFNEVDKVISYRIKRRDLWKFWRRRQALGGWIG
ncbi:MAG TPA: hypothetical protein PLH03_05090 [Methylophilaceae bacterium]|nr:hypothetical protein [Methylophilaceae bacterium]